MILQTVEFTLYSTMKNNTIDIISTLYYIIAQAGTCISLCHNESLSQTPYTHIRNRRIGGGK